jgi:hypothetical protein
LAATLHITWSKICNGADSVILSIYGPDGTVFQNHGGGNKEIVASAYIGATDLTTIQTTETIQGASFQWQYYESEWRNLTNEYTIAENKVAIKRENGTIVPYILVVHPDFVPSQKTIRCQMIYDNIEYYDTITMTDKTDNYSATIDSTGGEIFRNARGNSFLACRLWQNGQEVDALKSATSTDVLFSTSISGTDDEV